MHRLAWIFAISLLGFGNTDGPRHIRRDQRCFAEFEPYGPRLRLGRRRTVRRDIDPLF